MRIKQSIAALMVLILTIVGLNSMTTSASAAADYIQVSRQVTPGEITTEEEVTVELTIQGTPPVSVIRPNDVILIIDKSGSMAGDKIIAARDSAKGFIDLMDFNVHRVGIVDYSSSNNVKVFPITTDANAAKAYVNTIQASGGTGTGYAIDAAVTELMREPREGAQPVIVLMTDGDATEPNGSAYEYALDRAAAAKEQGIVFYTIALLNANDNPDTSGPNQLLTKMATTSSHHHFVLGSVGLSEIYAAIVKEIGIASAYDVTVTDYVSEHFEIVPDSYLHNIPQPTVSGNEISWSFLELKNNTLNFTYKVRPKTQNPGVFSVSTTAANVTYKDFAGANRNKLIGNKSIKVKLPAPVITSIVEPSGHPLGGNEVQINGDKFVNGARVFFNTYEARSVNFVDSKTLRVIVPPGSQGTVNVKVQNPDNQFATGSYQYMADPEVSSYSPTEGPMEGNTVISMYGNYFMPGVTVKFGDKSAVITTQRTGFLSLKTPAVTEVGLVDITIQNPDGTSLVIPSGFNYLEPEIPKLEITNVNLNTGLPEGGGTATIVGKRINPEVRVFFGDNEAQVKSVVSTERIQVIVPAGQPGKVDVKLVNPDGEEATLAEGYTYAYPDYPAPVVNTINPNQGEIQGGGTAFISGTGFVSGVKVLVNDIPATVTSNTLYRITIVIPASTVEGTFDVKVINPDGKEAILPASYTYILPPPPPAPVLNRISPDNGLITGNATVVLYGENFMGDAVVLFDDIELPTTFVRSDQLRIVTPASDEEKVVQVRIKNPDGQTTVENITYSYIEPQPEPVSITSLNQVSGITAGGNTVYINGSNFQRGIRVFFGDNEAEVKSYASARRIGVDVPPSLTTGLVDVTVLNPDKGQFTLPGAYRYTLTQPTISSLSVPSGLTTGGTIVYINGTNFEPTMSVTIDGTNTPFDYVSNKRVKIVTPPSQYAGEVPLVVTLDNGESATFNFTYEEPPKAPAPFIRAFNISSGPAAGGNTVYISGHNYVRGATVFFGDVESPNVIFNSTTRLGARIPAGSGVVQVKIVNPDGQESNTLEYTYQ
ncbi:IPT/TIG domain-containing protein [Paenibacillus lentus]|uniref:VWA domain-containing protein n=1 Tax=Paenibacillus lentus TaxID=1338368 RepID=A0A3S8RSI9_9BACL|nr:IPT/TIG domain-containing protein [Paenibacillus lentus]AZK45918.1 VWA domain-containing protein [Paenibacillus lentus]